MNNKEIKEQLRYREGSVFECCEACKYFTTTEHRYLPEKVYHNCTKMTSLGASVGPEKHCYCDEYEPK